MTNRGRTALTAGLAIVVLIVSTQCRSATTDTLDRLEPVAPTAADTDAASDTAPVTSPVTTTDARGGSPTTIASPPVPPTSDAPLPSGPDIAAIEVELVEVTGLDRPVNLAVRGTTANVVVDDDLYIVSQSGSIIAVDPVTGETRRVADLSAVTSADGERGLLGLAFSLDGRRAYVNYTANDGATIIAAYGVADDGTFDPDSAETILRIEQPYGNHNGGHLLMAPDGALLVGMGDGGAADDPDRVALDPDELLGKLLRIDTAASSTTPEILASGLRNPWKFTLDPVTGELWIADVGQNDTEEINRIAFDRLAGTSFGWSAYEGDRRFNTDLAADGHHPPAFVYRHGDDGCSISGGTVYRGRAIPAMYGAYVFGDYCSGRVWALDPSTGDRIEIARVEAVTAVLAGSDGELYVLDHAGAVARISAGRP